MTFGRPENPVPTIVTVVVLPTTIAPATRVAFSGTTKETVAAGDVERMYVESPAFVASTLQVPARLALSAFPDKVQPADDPAARVQVTAPVPVPPEIASRNVVPTEPLRVRTVTAACGVPTVVACVEVVNVLDESVAVSTQEPVVLMLRALNVAVPATAAAVVVPPSAHVEVIVTVSVDPVPEVTTLPPTSSTETLKVGIIVEAVVTVAGGAVVNTACVGAPADTSMTPLVAIANVLVESVATNWQVLPVFIVTAANVATPPTAVALVVPASVHADVNVTTSVEPVPDVTGMPLLSSIDTANEGRTVPAAIDDAGCVVNPTSAGAVVATFTATLVTVVLFVLSVATSAQLVPAVTVIVKAATPLVALIAPPPLKVQVDDAIAMESALPVSMLPLVSSTDTLNMGIATLIVAVVAGTVV
jgi:hypothetical protein